jgi:hypothetical protein
MRFSSAERCQRLVHDPDIDWSGRIVRRVAEAPALFGFFPAEAGKARDITAT